MRIRITRQHPGELYGISLNALHVGLTYDVSPSIATYLVTMNCAEAVIDETPALVVPVTGAVSDTPYPVNASMPASVAADRGRRSDPDF